MLIKHQGNKMSKYFARRWRYFQLIFEVPQDHFYIQCKHTCFWLNHTHFSCTVGHLSPTPFPLIKGGAASLNAKICVISVTVQTTQTATTMTKCWSGLGLLFCIYI